MAYDAKIILDSVAPCGRRLTTFELTYPRFVHSEFMTHRLLSRNSASSRAIPFDRMVAKVESDPVLPVYWGKNQKGMQAEEELTGWELQTAKHRWLRACDDANINARLLHGDGLHKQIVNRVLEPWSWITVIASATHWGNFFSLRRHAAAQPEIREIACMAGALYEANTPRALDSGVWHLPYVTDFEDTLRLLDVGFTMEDLCLVSAGRCAAVSYLNQDQHDIAKDLDRAGKMIRGGHWSPFEHQARAQSPEEMHCDVRRRMTSWLEQDTPPGNFLGWTQFRKTFAGEDLFRSA